MSYTPIDPIFERIDSVSGSLQAQIDDLNSPSDSVSLEGDNVFSGSTTFLQSISASGITNDISRQKIEVLMDGASVGTRSKINLLPSSGLVLEVSDNPSSGSIDIGLSLAPHTHEEIVEILAGVSGGIGPHDHNDLYPTLEMFAQVTGGVDNYDDRYPLLSQYASTSGNARTPLPHSHEEYLSLEFWRTASGSIGSSPTVPPSPTGSAYTSSSTSGSISVSGSVRAETSINIDNEGTIDWRANNGTNIDSYGKALGARQLRINSMGGNIFSAADITTYTFPDSDTIGDGGNSGKTGTWLGGSSTGHGFKIMAPAGTRKRVLKIYAGHWNTKLKVTCRLSDESFPDVIDNTFTTAQVDNNLTYTIIYNAASEGQVLTVTLRAEENYGNGNVSLYGAALAWA